MTACPCQSGLDYAHCCQPLHQGNLSQRPTGLDLDDHQQWLALEIIASGEDGDTGWVHFRATSKDRQGLAVQEERSRFVKENGHWYYLDGTPSVTALKAGRNDPCPCGSGKKFKKCCG